MKELYEVFRGQRFTTIGTIKIRALRRPNQQNLFWLLVDTNTVACHYSDEELLHFNGNPVAFLLFAILAFSHPQEGVPF